jgi:microcystin-dependent protein
VEIVFDPATVTDPKGITRANFPQEANPKVRRWDQKTTAEIRTSANSSILLEDGIEVKFGENDTYKAGDYWLIPARIATGQIEWPTIDGKPALQERSGNEHHYCRLGVLGFRDGTWEFRHNCRPVFSPLAEQINIFKISGDGQEALPGDELPQPLQVGVTNGLIRIVGVKVLFEVTVGEGQIKAIGRNFTRQPIEVETDENGVAECIFKIDKINQSQQVTATLRDPEDPLHKPHLHLPVRFNANISRAPAVAFEIEPCSETERDPPSVHSLFCDSEEETLENWPDLDNNGRVTVQDALAGLLLFLDAAKLPFKHKVPGSRFPESLPQTVAAALDYLSQRIVPAGMIMAFANAEPPEGWLECNGQEVTEAEFPDLYNALKDRFTPGDPVTVPNLQGEFIRGWDNGRGVDPGRNFGSLQFDQIQTHTHADTGHTHNDAGHTHSITDPGHRHLAPTSTGSAGDFEAAPTTKVGVDYIGAALTDSSTTGISVNSGAANIQSSNANLGAPIDFAGVTVRPGPETRPRNVALMYCIKT